MNFILTEVLMEGREKSFNQIEKKEILKRLHYVAGQIGGIERMVDSDRPIKEVYVQLKAVERSLHSTIYEVLDKQVKSRFAAVLADRLSKCPGDCDNAARLQILKKGFSELDLKDLIIEYEWLQHSAEELGKNDKSKLKGGER